LMQTEHFVQVDLSELSNGLYLCMIRNGKNIKTTSFVKVK